MANREIEARLKMTAVDQASRVIDKLGARVDALGKKMETVNKHQMAANQAERASAQAAAAAQKQRAVMLGLAATGVYVAGRAAKAAIVDFAALQREVTRIGITADASDSQIKNVSNTIMKMAQDTATPLSDVYAGFDALVSAGRSWDEALAFLPSVVKTAQAAGAETRDIAATADAMAGSMHIAGNEMQDAFDKLAKGGKMGKFELKDMASYLPSILPQMAALGYSGLDGLEKTVALLQTVRLQTGTAGEAATNLENVLGKIYSPETARAFKKQFNVDLPKSLKTAKDSGKDLLEAFLQITRKVTGGDMEKLAKVFTDQQFRSGVLALLQQENAMKGYAAGLKDAAGTIETDLGRVTKDAQADIDRLSNSWDNLLNKVGEATTKLGGASAMNGIAWAAGEVTKTVDGFGKIGQPDSVTQQELNDRKLQALSNDPAVKAYIEQYMSANGGKKPTAEQAMAHRQGFGDWLFNGSGDQNKRINDAANAGRMEGQAGSLAEQYRLRGETGNYPVRMGPTMPGPGVRDIIKGNVGPVTGSSFSPVVMYSPSTGRPYADPSIVKSAQSGSMVGGLELPPSNENLFIGAKGQFGEFTNEVVNAMANARKEVMVQAEDMAKELVTFVNGIAIPPIKIRVEGQTQLARVNPGVSMPDQ